MADYDGDIKLSVSMQPKDIKKSAKELQGAIKDVFDKNSGQNLDANLQKALTKISDMSTKTQQVIDKMEKLENTKVPTDEYTEIQRQINTTQSKLDKLQEAFDRNAEGVKKISPKKFKEMNYEVTELENTLLYAKGELEDLENNGKAFTLGSNTQEYENLSNKLGNLNNQTRVAVGNFEALKNKANGTSDSMKKLSSITSKNNNTLRKGISTLLKYGFGIRTIFLLYRNLRTSVAEAWKSMAQANDGNNAVNRSLSDLTSSLTQLKNSLGSAFAPILTAITPALDFLIQKLSKAINVIGMFFAAIQGKKTFTKAVRVQKDYASSLKDTASATKEAKDATEDYLSPLDEVNRYDDKSSSDSGSGGSASGGTGGEGFEEVPISDEFTKKAMEVKQLLEDMFPLVIGIGAAFAGWKVFNIITDLAAISPALANIMAIVVVIAGLVLAVVGYFHMWEDGVDWEGIIEYIGGISIAVGALLAVGQTLLAGIVLLVGGIAGIILAIKDMIENGVNAQNMGLLLLSTISLIIGVFLTFGATAGVVVSIIASVIAIIMGVVTAAGNGQAAFEAFRNTIKYFGDFIKKLFKGDVKGAFDSLGQSVKSLGNLWNIIWKSMAQLGGKAINKVVDLLNGFKIGPIPDWVPGIGGKKWSLKIPHVPIPQLAKGGVIPPNKEFLAVLGDQKHGTNIEAPLDTIVQAMQIALASNSNQGQGGKGGVYQFTAQLNRRTIFDEVIEEAKLRQMSSGRNPFII